MQMMTTHDSTAPYVHQTGSTHCKLLSSLQNQHARRDMRTYLATSSVCLVLSRSRVHYGLPLLHVAICIIAGMLAPWVSIDSTFDEKVRHKASVRQEVPSDS